MSNSNGEPQEPSGDRSRGNVNSTRGTRSRGIYIRARVRGSRISQRIKMKVDLNWVRKIGEISGTCVI